MTTQTQTQVVHVAGDGRPKVRPALIRAFVAEWIRLSSKRIWLITLASTIVYSAVLTVVMINTAPERAPAGLSLQALGEAGGGTLAVRTASAFTSVLILAVFVGMSAGSFARGTWRASLLQQARRLTLAVGTFGARMAVGAIIVAVLFGAGLVTSYLVAPGQDIDTGSWLSGQSLGIAADDYLRVMAFVVGWGLLGTLIGILTRSVAVGLGVGILWAGPIENLLGDNLSFGANWFPGLLLRYVVAPESAPVDGDIVVVRLVTYALVGLALVGLILHRRDVSN
ncbi:hypothetical protein [Flexivirga sp. B27]